MPELALSLSTLSQLVLARLLTTGQVPGPKAVRDELGQIVGQQLTSGEWETLLERTVEQLKAAGLLRVKPYRLTPEGREEALRYLGISASDVPEKLTWGTLKNKYLIPKALGLPVDQKTVRDKVSQSEGLKGAVVASYFELPIGPAPTSTAAIHALAWKELGVETDRKFTLSNVLWHLLGKHFASDSALDAKGIGTQLPVVVSGARNTKPEALRAAVLKKLLEGADLSLPPEPEPVATSEAVSEQTPVFEQPEPEESAEASQPFDLESFANTVQAVARRCESGRFGEDKVFIAHVWRQFQEESLANTLSAADFKTRLGEAWQAGLLPLVNAEFRQTLNLNDLNESELTSGGYEFHFIRLI